MSNSLKFWVKTTFKFSIVITAITYLILSGKLTWENIWPAGHKFYYVFFGAFLILIALLTNYVRLWFMLGAAGLKMKLSQIIKIGFISTFFNFIVIGGMGGEAVKLAYIAKATSNPGGSLSTIVVDRAIGLLGFFLIAASAFLLNLHFVLGAQTAHIFAPFFFGVSYGAFITTVVTIISVRNGRLSGLLVWIIIMAACAWLGASVFHGDISAFDSIYSLKSGLLGEMFIVFAAGNLCALFFLIVAPSLKRGGALRPFLKKHIPFSHHFDSVIQPILVYRDNLKIIALCLTLALFLHFVNLCALYLISRPLNPGNEASFTQIFFAAPLAFLANTLPLPGGGLGVGETAFDGLLALCRNEYGAPVRGGAAIFLMWRCWTIIIVLIGFIFCLKRKA